MSEKQEVFDYMNKCGVLFLGTENGDKPKVRPLGFRMLVDNEIYFLTGKSKDLYTQMLKNTSVEFVGQNEGEFIRYYGRVVFEEDEDKTLLKKAFETMPMLEQLYGDEGKDTAIIFRVQKATAEIRDMFGIKKSYDFIS